MKKFYNRCTECGKFLSYKNPIISLTPYGSSCDIDPPGEKYYCHKCWETIENNPTKLNIIKMTSWIKPHKLIFNT